MKTALVGYGAMGALVKELCDNVIGIVSPGYLDSLFQLKEIPEVIIDFSHPSNLKMIIEYATINQVPCLFATTGYSEEQQASIRELGKIVPVLFSGNYSLGVILMNKIVREITPILKRDFDIEILETHHNKKIDAPSGTAKMLFNSINQDNDFEEKDGRSGSMGRKPYEVGISSIRGGTIPGIHSVFFLGTDEAIEIKHTAYSKMIFAKGAIKGAIWLVQQEKGFYSMEDVLF